MLADSIILSNFCGKFKLITLFINSRESGNIYISATPKAVGMRTDAGIIT